MRRSPLLDWFHQHKTPLTDYRGSLTAERFDAEPPFLGDRPWPKGQLLLFDAPWRAPLEVRGPDARKWLNGMVTANVRDLAPGGTAPAFQLDPKGHILASLDVHCLAVDAFLLLTDQTQCAELELRLRRFVFIAKIELNNRSEELSSVVVRGPDCSERGPKLPAHPETLLLESAPGGIAQRELVAPAALLAELWPAWASDALPAGALAQEHDRIWSRVPRFGADFGSTELPQETGQSDRLDFTKGCYVGQEIVERIRARGAVHRHWSAFHFATEVAPGDHVRVGGAEAGRITSATPTRDGGCFALGYLRTPHDVPGTAVVAAAPGSASAGEVAGVVEDLV